MFAGARGDEKRRGGNWIQVTMKVADSATYAQGLELKKYYGDASWNQIENCRPKSFWVFV